MDANSLDGAVAELAARVGVRDGMVFRRINRTSWAHLGGIGRGRAGPASSRSTAPVTRWSTWSRQLSAS